MEEVIEHDGAMWRVFCCVDSFSLLGGRDVGEGELRFFYQEDWECHVCECVPVYSLFCIILGS